MVKKKKKSIWHKKKGKFISPDLMSSHKSPDNSNGTENEDKTLNRKKVFAKNLSEQIKKAVRDDSL